MGLNDFIGYWRKGTFNYLKAIDKFYIGNQQLVLNNGNSYFVDSAASNASDSNSGTSWSQPLATLDAANNKCTANNGDIIYVSEGHSESWTTTGAKVVLDTAGVTVVGLGTGSNRPTFSFGHTGTTWTISAANVTLINLLIVTAVDLVTTYGTISGADCKMIGIETRDAANKEVVNAWTCTTGATRLMVDGYKHVGDIATGDANDSIFNLTDVADWTIKNSSFMTKIQTGIIEIASTATKAVVDNCYFYVDGTSDLSLNIVDTDDDSTLIVRNCYDLEASSGFSGGNTGSGFAVAVDDTGAVATALAVVDTNVDTLLSNENVLKVTIADGTTITNNTQVAAGLLATASGDVLIEEITVQRGATNFTGPTNLEFTVDNAAGLTGVDAPVGDMLLAKFNANVTSVLSLDGNNAKQLPFVLEDTKKLYIHGDDAAVGAGGTTDFYIKYRGIGSSAASIS